MSKVVKKVRKTLAKFDLGHQFLKKAGLPEPFGDILYGSDKALSPAEAAAKAAEEQANRQYQQAQDQAKNTIEQARGAGLSAQAAAERERILAAAKDAESTPAAAPTVEIAPSSEAPAAKRRKRFQGSTASTSPSGVSVRI